MNAYMSWAIFLAVLGFLSWHYAGRPNLFDKINSQKLSPESSHQASGASTRKSKAKGKRGGTDSLTNETNAPHQLHSAGSSVSRKRKIATPPQSGLEVAFSSSTGGVPKQTALTSPKDEDIRKNTEFAREMVSARVGTQPAGSDKPGMNKRERGAQNKGSLRTSNDTESPSLSTGASSTTGADADDDLSPVASPPLLATSTVATSNSGDISDMLGHASAGPSVLRLTEPANPVPKAKAKQSKRTFEPAETKKQRQQRIKREAHRAQVEEAERQRQRLLEKQIRGARMAEGTSAQTRTSAFKPPAQNVWFSGPAEPPAESMAAPSASSLSLLDTFEPQHGSATSVTHGMDTAPLGSVTDRKISTDNGRTGAAEETVDARIAEGPAGSEKTGSDWAKGLPVEEDQMRLIQESEDSWTTVSKRDKKKASKPPIGKENDTSEASGAESRHANGVDLKTTASSRPTFPSSSNSYYQLGDSGFQDSDWVA
ncbi:hypothetical protein EPUS_01426 [Endocarpon pusillum Z07020]|uniref:Inner centromere protein ARK-binding domain-containing protein n=1 Tax=Endocarpon pusillum (strain Z07020 / HMAS-L-300199) TaxID=1263415 RepID=U1GUG5_ENDPU|nr:uncharacterized protein EPUS_01426 [Endocarpon pusillum Z07020]ERF76093.1 hypothetical protein EPUS_01426 [Endocarpon pusillum Z07020]